ncbi:hypothetical protein ABZZ37_18445 [Streptomyces sp. NPDC006464]|uniref:hypothetical protein n=1 Tax=Streptomyces sp. NPDC006464 TaxID=3154305 RepID=UPI0033B03E52
MRSLFRIAVAATVMATTALTGCSKDTGRPPVSAPSTSAAPSPPVTRAEVVERTRTALVKATAFKGDAPGRAGHLLIEAWPDGSAAYAWETGDHRLCQASVAGDMVFHQTCATHPHDPAVAKRQGVSPLFTSFAHGWGRIFAADHQQVIGASCSGTSVKILKIGTVANGARTLYAMWFPDYTKGEVLLTLRHGTTTSHKPFHLGDAGTQSCTATPTRPAHMGS